jgi:hypothetical protein
MFGKHYTATIMPVKGSNVPSDDPPTLQIVALQ